MGHDGRRSGLRSPRRTTVAAGLAAALVATLVPTWLASAPVAASVGDAAFVAARVADAAQLREFDGNAPLPVPAGVEPLRVEAHPLAPARVWEPTIGVAQDGTAFMTSVVDVGPRVAMDLLRSDDDGRTWSSVQPRVPGAGVPDPPTTFDPVVHVDPATSRVFALNLYVACHHMHWSDDLGDTWTPNPVACGDAIIDRPTIGSGPPPPALADLMLYPSVVYVCTNRAIDTTCARSLDGGVTFLPTRNPAIANVDPTQNDTCGSPSGDVEVAADGTVAVPRAVCGLPRVAVSRDGGDTWSASDVSPILTDRNITAAAFDDAGNLYTAWIDIERQIPLLAVSRDGGASWEAPFAVSAPGVLGANMIVVTAGAAGRVALTYLATADDPKSSDATWRHVTVVTTDALADAPTWLAAEVAAGDDPLLRGPCQSYRCTGIGDFLDAHVGPDGTLWATAADSCTEACVTGAPSTVDRGQGVVVRQTGGPLLRP